MAETWILLALLGLPLLGSDELWALLAVPLAVLSACTVGIGVWAWTDHRCPPAGRDALGAVPGGERE